MANISGGGSAPNTSSTLLNADTGQNKTSTALSTNIVVVVNGTPVGAVRNISINESRDVRMIDEVGTDGHIDSAPTKSVDVSGSCSRTRFDGMRVAEAFSRGYVHVSSQRIPFDIEIHDIFQSPTDNLGNATNPIITVIKNVWIKGIKYQYKSDDFVIVDDMDWVAETIYSTLGNSNSNAVDPANSGIGGGQRRFVVDSNSIERAADRGDRRGALDAANLIGVFGF